MLVLYMKNLLCSEAVMVQVKKTLPSFEKEFHLDKYTKMHALLLLGLEKNCGKLNSLDNDLKIETID